MQDAAALFTNVVEKEFHEVRGSKVVGAPNLRASGWGYALPEGG
jgi:hypothetical protein